VVTTLLHGHRRKTQARESLAGRVVTVGGDAQRALRIVGGGIDAERHYERIGTEVPNRLGELVDSGHPGLITEALSQWEVAVGAVTVASAALIGVTHVVRKPPSSRIDVQRPVEHVTAVVEDGLRPVAVMGVDVDHSDLVATTHTQRVGGHRGIVEVARPAVAVLGDVVPWRSAEGVRQGVLAFGDQVDCGEGGVDRAPCGLPGARSHKCHGVVREPPRPAVDPGRQPQGHSRQEGTRGEHVRHDPGLTRDLEEAGSNPLVVAVAKPRHHVGIVDGEQLTVVVDSCGDLARAGVLQSCPNDIGALGDLGALNRHTDPHLAGGFVTRAVLGPNEWSSQGHGRHDVTVPRPRDVGIAIGPLPTGVTNSILDVPGVGVGHSTVWRDEPAPPKGRGSARTGVTVIDPGGDTFADPIPFGAVALNGAGEMTGYVTAQEWGLLESPIFLTSSMQVGRVFDAACELAMEGNPVIGGDEVMLPVVAECDDSFVNDARSMQVTKEDVRSAWEQARASVGSTQPPAEGSVGSGTGMACLGYKGGIGTSSRVLPSGHTVAVLLMSNFGEFERLTVAGVRVSRWLTDPSSEHPDVSSDPGPKGSCIVVVATDAPIDHAGCERLARRAGMGLARTGSTAHHGSGEIFMAFATGLRVPRKQRPTVQPIVGSDLDDFFAAVIDATEESVLSSMMQSQTVVGRDGNTLYGLPVPEVLELVGKFGGL
jgi:D-aminopeptidase